MRRLIGLPLDVRQEDEIMRMLTEAGIAYRETRSPFRLLSGDAIWVSDEDYPQASALLESEVKAFAEIARGQWNAEWVTEHNGSYVRWLWSRVIERTSGLDSALRHASRDSFLSKGTRMSTMEIAMKMSELCREGKNSEALDSLFSDDTVSVGREDDHVRVRGPLAVSSHSLHANSLLMMVVP